MKVIIMGCGRVGSELALQLLDADHEVAVIDKNPDAFIKYPPGDGREDDRGLGVRPRRAGGGRHQGRRRVRRRLQRRQLEHRLGAGRARALPRAQGRRADLRPAPRRHLRAPQHPDGRHHQVGREADPADAVPRPQRAPESLGGGDLVRMRVPVPPHLVGKSADVDQRARASSWSPAVSRGGGGFIPTDEIDAAGGRLPRRDHGEGRHGPPRRRSRAAVAGELH